MINVFLYKAVTGDCSCSAADDDDKQANVGAAQVGAAYRLSDGTKSLWIYFRLLESLRPSAAYSFITSDELIVC